jgi:protein disulfide-isomerase A1
VLQLSFIISRFAIGRAKKRLFIPICFQYAEEFLEDFVKQSLLPLAMPINSDSLKTLKDDDRKIALTIVEDETDEKSKKIIKLLKAAASANRDLVFGYVGVKQFEDFADTFGANKKTTLPKMVVWGGDDEYFSVSYIFSGGKKKNCLRFLC